MGKESRSETEILDKEQLIDFLYVDKERTDSLISQIHSGTLRSVTKTTGAAQGSSLSATGNAKILQGTYTNNGKSTKSASEQYDPYHSQIIELLSDLNIDPATRLPYPCAGVLTLLKSSILIRDIGTMKSIIPVIQNNKRIFGLGMDEKTKIMVKLMNDMLQKMSDTITLTIPFYPFNSKNDKFSPQNITGTLKPSGLSIRQDDLMRTYGITIPGEWYILGILDYSAHHDEDVPHIDSIESAIDVFATAMNTIYSTSVYKIIPILIFRSINY